MARRHAGLRSSIACTTRSGIALAITVGLASAQAQHPFAAPTSIPAFTLGGVGGVFDYNRDGSPDVIAPSVFFGTLLTALDEDGRALAVNAGGPGHVVPGTPSLPTALAMACGDVDGDGRDDLVSVTSVGTVHLHRNLGSTRLGAANVAPDVVVDNFAAAYPISPPMVSYWFPVAKVVDFDRDGNQDIVVGGGRIDRWSGNTMPGFVAFYRGNGAGQFAIHRHQVAGDVVDLEVADLDANGVPDRLVALTETGGVGAFQQELVHLSFSGGQLFATSAPHNLGGGRFTALAVADVVGDGNADYVLTQTTPSGGTITSSVMWQQGDGAGNVLSWNWGYFYLPPNPTALQDYVPAVEAGDWNRDGHVDLAVVRGFVQPTNTMSTAQPTYADSELLVALGPNLPFATFESIALPGAHSWSSTYNQLFPLLPLFGAPGLLQTFDLRQDGSVDLLVLGMRGQNGTAGTTCIATLVNTTPGQTGDARMQKVGDASGGLPTRKARLGFDGGRPKPGNAAFGCTLQNVQGGSLCGIAWGPLGYERLFTSYGVDVHMVPVEYGAAALASGTGSSDGFFRQALPIPNIPALVGDAGYFQFAYYDHVSGTFGGSHATGLSIGQ
jgi:hypothetical protein